MKDDTSAATETVLGTLQEIRDLLAPLSAQARAWIVAEGPAAIRDIVGTGQREAAARLMDGKRQRSDIKASTGIADSHLSDLIKDLREAGFTKERERRPKLVISPGSVWPNTKASKNAKTPKAKRKT